MNIEQVIDKRSHDLGGGFMVGRLMPTRAKRSVGPFVFIDHMGPLELAPGIPRELDVRPHPHIGLSTVTYLFDGAITHRDSLGFKQEIKPGAVNWMTAGKGITHSERLEYARAHGANMHGLQTWVALPAEYEETEPAFYHHASDTLPTWQDNGVSGRLIVGEIDGLKAPVKTFSPMFYQHLVMPPNTKHSLSTQYSERAIYVVSGNVDVDGQAANAGQLIILNAGNAITIKANQQSVVMLLGGEPLGERYMLWNFVSSSKERLQEAKLDWQQGRMALPVGDDQEFIALPKGW